MVGHHTAVDVTNRKNLLHKEPAVIDQDMIIDAIKKTLPKGNEGKYAKEAGIDPKKAQVLTIEFQSISQIANISHMTLLKKLSLSNNVITRIEGLSTLVNLEELDLSFNSIKKFEGLDYLPKLKIINVHRNLITVIENLDKTLHLEVLVLSSNGIRSFDDLRHLRRLVRLRALVLEGNPISDDPDYRNFILALLPDLLILDYVRVKVTERFSPDVIKFQNKIQAIAQVEDASRRHASVVEANEELQKVYKEAFADGLNGDELWTSLDAQDANGEILMQLSGVKEIRQIFQELMSETCHELFVKAMRAYTMRQNEYKAFDTAVKEIKDDVVLHGRELTEEFLQYSETVMTDKLNPVMAQLELRDRINGGTEFKGGKVPPDYLKLQEQLTTDVLAYIKKLHKLWYCLVSGEVELNEQIMEVGQELERSLRELMTNWIEQLGGYFDQIREVQLKLDEHLKESLVNVTSDEDEDDQLSTSTNLPEHLSTLVTDKEALAGIIQASHENRIVAINGNEEVLISKLKNWTETAMAGIRTDEVDRSRRRISEISHFADFHYSTLNVSKMISHCLGVILPLREDQTYIPTKKELKEKRLQRRQEKENEEQNESLLNVLA